MSLTIVPYKEERTFAVKCFNERLEAGGVKFRFPESHRPGWLPREEGSPLWQDFYLVLDDPGEVRGAYMLKHQDFLVNGETTSVGNYQLPLSEGTVDDRYSKVGVLMLADALKRQPLLYALGMGGRDRPLPRMLEAMGFRLMVVPFYFRVCHPQRFLMNLSLLRERPAWRLLSTAAAATGVGHLGIVSLQASRRKKRGRLGRLELDEVERFDGTVDAIWESGAEHYSFAAKRTRPVLKRLYPAGDSRFHRLMIKADGATVGWAVALDTQMRDHKQFGDMRVGSIADAMAAPEHADAIVTAATDYLEERGVDIVVSNQSHPWWGTALANCGFLSGPSNFVLAVSPALAARIEKTDESFDKLLINRGDGDGPIHL